MPLKTSTPMSGRFRLEESELFLSVHGWPVAGSSGGLTLAITAQRSAPQGWMRIVQPSLSTQRPVGSASAGSIKINISASTAKAAVSVKHDLIARASLDLHHAPVLERHPPVHPLRQFHVVRGDDRGEPGGAHELRQGLEDVGRG